MIKLIAIGVWICLVTAGTGYGVAIMNLGKTPEGEKNGYFGGLDYIKTELFSVPIIKRGIHEGYVVTQLVFTIKARHVSQLSVPPETLIIDEAFRTIYSEILLDFDNLERADLKALAQHIRDNANARFKAELIDEVLVQQFNYLSKDEIRDRKIRKG